MATDAYVNNGSYYPLTKMNFLVTCSELSGTAAFSEVTGIEASVDVIEFRQGNSGSLAPVKIPGLVKHGNVTFRMGYIKENSFKDWIQKCVGEVRSGAYPRYDLTVELIDINSGSPGPQAQESNTSDNRVWILRNAWVAKYNAPDFDAKTSDVAIETMEVAYEQLEIPAV